MDKHRRLRISVSLQYVDRVLHPLDIMVPYGLLGIVESGGVNRIARNLRWRISTIRVCYGAMPRLKVKVDDPDLMAKKYSNFL